MGILNEGGALSFEVKGLFPFEYHPLFRCDADYVEPHRPDANHFCYFFLLFIWGIWPSLLHFYKGSSNAFIYQVIHGYVDPPPGGHASFRQGNELVNDKLRLFFPQDFERCPHLLGDEFVVGTPNVDYMARFGLP